MEYKDYYKTLGVDRKASEAEIKKQYRKLAKKYHPDKNQGDATAEQKFKEIGEAYEVLGDKDKRAKYDQFGQNYKQFQQQGGSADDFWRQYGGGQQGGGGYTYYQGDFGDAFGGGSFSDFFQNLFGGGGFGSGGFQQQRARTRRAPSKGQDYNADYSVSLLDAYQGVDTIINVGTRKLKLKLKPGIQDGQKLRLKGKGGPAPHGGVAGDLYLNVKVDPDKRFERKGNDLYADLTVRDYVAVLGGKVDVPLVKGKISLTIPEGTKSGKVLRLKGKGMPVYGSENDKGNLYLTVKIAVSDKQTQEERKLYEKLQELDAKK